MIKSCLMSLALCVLLVSYSHQDDACNDNSSSSKCDSIHCQNGAICVDRPDVEIGFECILCFDHWGDYCENGKCN